MIDTHCHLNFKAFDHDRDEVISEMRRKNIRGIVVGSQNSTSKRAVALAKKHSGFLFAAVALHPLHLHSMFVNEIEMPFQTRAEVFDKNFYLQLAKEKEVRAIGECGLDYYRIPNDVSEKAFKQKQWNVFQQHIELAQELDLPLIVHTRANPQNYRDAYEDVFALLKQSGLKKVVMHAFATFPKLAEKFLDEGYMISFTGLITYPEYPVLTDVVKMVPLERMMLETDAPYMTPHALRGKRNTPLGVIQVAETVATYTHVDVTEIQQQTTRNAKRFFNIF